MKRLGSRFLKGMVVLALVGFLWVLASTNTGDPKERSSGILVQSDRKRKHGDRTAVGGPERRMEREPRSLLELQKEYEIFCRKCQDGSGGFFYIPDLMEPPAGVQTWLDGLTDEEKVILSKSLFQQVLDDPETTTPTESSLLSVLFSVWGKKDPLGALAYEGSFEDDYSLSIKWSFRVCVYAGWASENPKAAWSHFEPVVMEAESGEVPERYANNPYAYRSIVAGILGQLARKAPEMVWELLNKQGQDFGFDPRVWTLVVKGLPDGSNWEKIAGDFQEILFSPSGNLVDRILSGAAESDKVIFARWANEEPAEALQWFEAKVGGGTSGGQKSLIGDWYQLFPSQAASWINHKLREGDQKYEEISWQMAARGLNVDTLRWSRNNPISQTRFEIFKVAAMPKTILDQLPLVKFVGGEAIYQLRGDPFEIEFLERELPGFRLTDEQEIEIRKILRKRREGTAAPPDK